MLGLLLKIAILFVLCFTLVAWIGLRVLNVVLRGVRARRLFCDWLDWHQPFDIWSDSNPSGHYRTHYGEGHQSWTYEGPVCSRCGRQLTDDGGGVYRALYSDEGGYRD